MAHWGAAVGMPTEIAVDARFRSTRTPLTGCALSRLCPAAQVHFGAQRSTASLRCARIPRGHFRALTAALVLVAVACAQAPAHAEVTASGTGGFAMKIDLPVAAPPDRVFERFLEIGRWWSDEHTYSGHASNMTLRNEPGGCFCETLPNGGFIRHATIEYSDPGKALYLSGALGPLLVLGAHGLLAVQFKAEGGGSRLVATYVVSGFPQGKGFAELAPLVDQVLLEQFTRLKRFVETGKPGT